MLNKSGTIRLPANEGANGSGPPSPESLDDSVSIHSRHALKVFRSGTMKDGNASPLESGISVPGARSDDDDDDNDHRTEAQRSAETLAAQEEAADWRRFRNRTLLQAALQFTVLLVSCAALLAVTLYFVLPKIDDADRPALKIPRTFEQLKALNAVLQRYKDEYFFRVMFCWIVIYMFLQAFSVPGSMYMSIIAGAMWGVPLALPIVCATVATGATICYLISAYLGAVLIAMPKWKARVDAWGEVLSQHNDNMLSYLIVIRMMPLPPHNVVNILAPHLGIKIPLFWISTFFGIFAVSVIHVTIGEKLDQMTSADDFHIVSLRNALLLGGVILAVLVPVFVRKYSAVASTPLEESEGAGRVRLPDEDEDENDEIGTRNAFDSDDDDDDDDELPRVRRLQGARRSGRPNGESGSMLAVEDEEGRAAYVARAWRGVEVDADQHSDGGGAASDNEHTSIPIFEDRREQASRRQRSYARAAPPKARRVLGLHRNGGDARRSPAAAEGSYVSQLSGWVNSKLGR